MKLVWFKFISAHIADYFLSPFLVLPSLKNHKSSTVHGNFVPAVASVADLRVRAAQVRGS